MDAKLIVVGGDVEESEVLLELPSVLGRSRSAALQLHHPLVSRRHCEIFESDGSLHVRDLNSMNGTFVGNERISERELQCGDLLTIGAVTFRVFFGEETIPSSRTLAGTSNGTRMIVAPSIDETAFADQEETPLEDLHEEAQTQPESARQERHGAV